MGGTVSARSPDDKIPSEMYKTLLKRRSDDDWTSEQWRAVMAQKGYSFSYQDARVIALNKNEDGQPTAVTTQKLPPVEDREPGAPGTEEMNEDNCHLKLTYAEGSDGNHLNYTWSNKDPWFGKAESPHDFATASFVSDDYDWDPSIDMEWGTQAAASESVSAAGPTFRNARYDASGHAQFTFGRFESYLDGGIKPVGGSPDTRQIYVDYVARQEDVAPVGVNIGTGATISFRDKTSYWRAEAFAYESQMASGDGYEETDPI